MITHTAIWVRLSQLPTKFYDKQIWKRQAKKGEATEIDACTFVTLSGRYARICVQIPLDTLVRSEVIIGMHKQKVVYEGEGILFLICIQIETTKEPNHQLKKTRYPWNWQWKTLLRAVGRSLVSLERPPNGIDTIMDQ